MIDELYGWCQPVLPMVYDDSITFVETVAKIRAKINEVIKYVNALDLQNHKYVDSEIKKLRDYVDTQDSKIENSLTNYINNQIGVISSEIVKLDLSVQKKLQSLNDKIDRESLILTDKITYEIANLKSEFEEMLKKYSVLCYNPTNGKTENFNDVLQDVYEYLRYGALTALQFDSIGITAEEFDNKGLTAIEFDVYGYCKLYKPKSNGYMTNPFTGLWQDISIVISDLNSYVNKGLTAKGFDELNLTAQEFDNKQITAYDFDYNGSIILN